MSEAALRLEGIVRRFRQADAMLDVLRGASLDLQAGEAVALLGPSGAGKSTLLHIAGLLEYPDAGSVFLAGKDASRMSDDGRTRLRRTEIGFVYQFHHLLPEFSALENVMVPQMIAGVARSGARERAHALLRTVGLEARETHRPARLSGGEQQRVALARALANDPAVLLADEPTGNLDVRTADAVFATLVERVREGGLAALVATHNLDLARRMDRIVRLQDGLLVDG